MADTNDIPCIPFPEAKTFTIPLPFGGALKSLTDISKGPPSDCALVHSLMLQISPMLAGMTCMLRIMGVIIALKDFTTSTLDDIVPNLKTLGEKIDEVTDCFLLLDPCKIAEMIAAILRIIIAYLNCMIEAVESILNFKAGIDLNAAQGNPVLLASLNCAENNAQSSYASLMEAMEGLKPLLDMASMLLEIVGLPPIELPPTAASTPSLADLGPDVDPLEPVKVLRDTLQQVLSALELVC